jgi:hypothetical protein
MSGRYIVVFKKHVGQESINKYVTDVQNSGGEVTHRYNPSVINGFTARIPDSFMTSLQSLQGDIIDYIEPDGVVTTQ